MGQERRSLYRPIFKTGLITVNNGRIAEDNSLMRVDEFMSLNGIDYFYGYWPEEDMYPVGNRLASGTSEKEEIASLSGFAIYTHRLYQKLGGEI